MAVIVSRAQIDKVKAALASVQSNGQALAALRAAQKTAAELGSHLDSVGGPTRDRAAADLKEYSRRLDPFVKSFNGNADGPVASSWNAPKGAREQVFNLYMLAFTLETTMAENQVLADTLGAAISDAVARLPETLGNAAKVAAKAVNTVATEAAKVGGSIAWGVFAGAWPLILIAGVGAVLYITAKGKLAKAVSL